MNIKKKLIKYNFTEGRKDKIKYIVIHDTGNKGKGANAESHFIYFNGGNRNASAHYFVDDKEILQLVEDINTAWHVGDGKGKYGITNANSIGIEICVNSDGDYAKAVKNAIMLTKHLMAIYKVDFNNVVRHYDASRKICPASMQPNNWEGWENFKRELRKELNQPMANPIVDNRNDPSSWAKEAWEWAKENNITDGSRPKDNTTREEVITMLYRFKEVIK